MSNVQSGGKSYSLAIDSLQQEKSKKTTYPLPALANSIWNYFAGGNFSNDSFSINNMSSTSSAHGQ